MFRRNFWLCAAPALAVASDYNFALDVDALFRQRIVVFRNRIT